MSGDSLINFIKSYYIYKLQTIQMSRNYQYNDRRGRDWNDRDNSRNYNRDRDRDDYRSRDKNQTWKRDRNQQGGNNNDQGWSNNINQNYNRNNHHKPWHRSNNKHNQDPITRQIIQCKVPKPIAFTISQSPKFINPAEPKFRVNIITSEVPPIKHQSRADQLKSKITPIQKIWTSTIKQYLNDSEFVEIYRKGKSLAYGDVDYGKTIINYDEGDKSMHYENQTSQSKIFSRAYFKIWEILDMGVFVGKQKQTLKIGCVAEGPGGFIHALIDYRIKHSAPIDKYYAITLKISSNTRNAKDWSDFRGKDHFDQMRSLGYKIKLSYGQTGTGDLLKPENIDYFAEHDLQGSKCYLVTGDGGIQCIGDKQFDYQQVFNVKLFLGQILAALKIQQLGGKFILKIYDCSFDLTKQLITLLSVFYGKVQIVKPVTSRPGNSQKYILSQGFLGMSETEEKQLKRLLNDWTTVQPNLSYFQNTKFVTSILQFQNLQNSAKIQDNLNAANTFFLQQQIDKLEEGIKLVEDHEGDQEQIQQILKKRRYKEQMGYAYEWCRMYGISAIKVQYQQEPQKKEQKGEPIKEQ